jgi:hypothetical protein
MPREPGEFGVSDLRGANYGLVQLNRDRKQALKREAFRSYKAVFWSRAADRCLVFHPPIRAGGLMRVRLLESRYKAESVLARRADRIAREQPSKVD